MEHTFLMVPTYDSSAIHQGFTCEIDFGDFHSSEGCNKKNSKFEERFYINSFFIINRGRNWLSKKLSLASLKK